MIHQTTTADPYRPENRLAANGSARTVGAMFATACPGRLDR